MKIHFLKGLFVSFLLLFALSFSGQAQSGCGDCWQNGVKSVGFNPFGAAHILCNCHTRVGSAGANCVCNPEM